MLPKKLQQKLDNRSANNALRALKTQSDLVDFSSNDYLGFSKNEAIFDGAHKFLIEHNIKQNGATGSRLLSGNHVLCTKVEQQLCESHNSPSAIIFNSGYDANVGFFSCVPQRGDVILYDEFVHASIRDGISMSHAKAYKFKHNDLEQLEEMLKRSDSYRNQHDNIYVVSESVFSMDGDTPDLVALTKICKAHNAHLIIDEAHAIGVFGKNGEGLTQALQLENKVFARIITFGKAMGCHGAAILGSEALKQYLVNFSRSFIYTTALPPHSLATIRTAYEELKDSESITKLHENIAYFKTKIQSLNMPIFPFGKMPEGPWGFIASNSAIQCCIISGNARVKSIAEQLQNNGFDVKPILSPTVPQGRERLRFCLHSYNSKKEISKFLELLATFVNL